MAVSAPSIPSALIELERSGPVPLDDRLVDPSAPFRLAAVIPSFRRGSGGHTTIVHLMGELHRRGHAVSLWLEDSEGRHQSESERATRDQFAEFFPSDGLDLHVGFEGWVGADLVLGTGWQTVPRTLLLPRVSERAYLVQDHEPDFYGVSAQSLLAAATYRQGLHCVAASPWLADLLRTRYGASASHFDLAADHSVYRPGSDARREDLIVFYARASTPRRAVPLGLLALEELASRRPELEIALFGEGAGLRVPFRRTDFGVLAAPALSELYRRATVGVVFSLTNPSLVSLEMMACGLPCVELASEPMLASFGHDGPLELAEPTPLQICAAIERVLDDRGRRDELSSRGLEAMRLRTWANAADQLEHALRAVTAP